MDRWESNSILEKMNISFISAESADCYHLRQRFNQVYPVEQWKEEGFFVDEDIMDIHCHWLQFEPVRPSVHFTLAVIYAIIFIIGFLSNALVIYVIVSSKKLLTPANILLVNLALSDLLIVSMIPIFIFNSFQQGPAIGKSGCYVYGFLTGLSGTCSIMSLAAVAIDRYLVISRPLQVDRKPTRSWAYFTALLTWLYSVTFASLPLFGIGKYVPEGYLTSCSFDYLSDDWTTRIFIFVFFVGAWVVPLSISVFAYTAIIRAVVYVRRNVVNSAQSTGESNNANRLPDSESISNARPNANSITARPLQGGINQPNVEVSIAKIVVGLIGVWLLAWTPYTLVSLAGICGYSHFLTPFSSMVPALFAKTAACVDPFIYALNHPKIRREIFIRLHQRFFNNSTVGTGVNVAIGGTTVVAGSRQGSRWDSVALHSGVDSQHPLSTARRINNHQLYSDPPNQSTRYSSGCVSATNHSRRPSSTFRKQPSNDGRNKKYHMRAQLNSSKRGEIVSHRVEELSSHLPCGSAESRTVSDERDLNFKPVTPHIPVKTIILHPPVPSSTKKMYGPSHHHGRDSASLMEMRAQNSGNSTHRWSSLEMIQQTRSRTSLNNTNVTRLPAHRSATLSSSL